MALKLEDLKPGDRIIPTGDFLYMRPPEVKTVQMDSTGKFFVDCDRGVHFLDDHDLEDFVWAEEE